MEQLEWWYTKPTHGYAAAGTSSDTSWLRGPAEGRLGLNYVNVSRVMPD